jgi:hypothetical protein
MTHRLALGCCLLVALQRPATAASQGEGPSPRLTAPQFVAQIEGLASAIETADAGAAARLAPSIPVSEHVVAGGETYEVRLDWLRSALRAPDANPKAWPSRRDDLVARLRAIAREAEATGVPREGTDARQALTAVLAQKSFQRVRAQSWQADLQRRIARWVADLLDRTFGRRVGQRSVALFVAWTASIAAVLVLVVWLARMSSRRRADRPMSVGPLHARRPPGHVLGLQAASLIRTGQIREGARVAYRAAVNRLEEEGALRVDEARTPREYLRLLPPVHRRHATLSALTTTFERIWYGSRAAAPDEGDKILALLQDLGCLYFDRAK